MARERANDALSPDLLALSASRVLPHCHQKAFDVMPAVSLLRLIRDASVATIVIAEGISCWQQILDVTEREALHVARVLATALDAKD